MSSSRIEQIIEEIEDYIDTCKGPLFSSGDKIVVVQRYLGHKNVATTEVYAKISDVQKRASVGCITLKK